MAVLVQFTTLLVRVDRLTAVAPDAVARIMKDWSPSWRDEHLLAVAFMDMGAPDLAGELEGLGLVLRDSSSGTKMWRDVCVVDYYEGPTNPCPWLEYDAAAHVAWLKGSPRGEVAGPTHVHEDAPIRVSPDKFQQLMQQQHPAPAPAARPSVALAPSHESRLLPLSHRLAAELLKSVPPSAKLELLVFMASFPRRGQEVHAGLFLHELAGERRAFSLAHTSDEAKALLREISNYDSHEAITSLEIRIAGDGQTRTRFGVFRSLDADGLAAHLASNYGAIARARPATLPAVGCIPGLLRAVFGPKLKLYPPPQLQHLPQPEKLSTLLDPMDGIHEGWDEPPEAPSGPRLKPLSVPYPRPQGPMPADPVLGTQLEIPATEGVLCSEARLFHEVSPAELQRARPELRFDPVHERFTRDLGPELGELRFPIFQARVVSATLSVDGLPTFAALLARLPPVLAALGGMGPLSDALSKSHPAMLRGEATPMRLVTARDALIPDSPYGRRVVCCWLLGAPHYTTVALDLSVGVVDGEPSFGFTVIIRPV